MSKLDTVIATLTKLKSEIEGKLQEAQRAIDEKRVSDARLLLMAEIKTASDTLSDAIKIRLASKKVDKSGQLLAKHATSFASLDQLQKSVEEALEALKTMLSKLDEPPKILAPTPVRINPPVSPKPKPITPEIEPPKTQETLPTTPPLINFIRPPTPSPEPTLDIKQDLETTEPQVERKIDMSKLDEAIVILTKLATYLELKKNEATDAGIASNYVGALKILEEAIQHADREKSKADTKRKDSKKTDNHGNIKPEFSDKFKALDTLQTTVNAEYAFLLKMKALYAQSIKQEGRPVVQPTPKKAPDVKPPEPAKPPTNPALSAKREEEHQKVELHAAKETPAPTKTPLIVDAPPIITAEEAPHVGAPPPVQKQPVPAPPAVLPPPNPEPIPPVEAPKPLEVAAKPAPLEEPLKMPMDEETLYTFSLRQLKEMKNKPHKGVGVAPKELDDLIEFIEKAKQNKEQLTPLIDALQYTHRRLTDQMSSQTYRDRANLMIGHPNTTLKILGGLMLALCIAILACTVLITPLLTSVGAGMATGAGSMLAINASIAAGLTFFAKSKASGLSQKMLETDKVATEKGVVYPMGP